MRGVCGGARWEEADIRRSKQCSWSETCGGSEGNVHRMHWVKCWLNPRRALLTSGMFRCLCQNCWPLPSEPIKQHLMRVRESINPGCSESFGVKSHSDWKVIAALLLSGGRKKTGWPPNNWHFGFDMLLRKEEEEVHNEEGALKACNDSGWRTQRWSGGG